MLTANVENMLVTSIGRTLETGVLLTQYNVIISTVRRQSEVGIQRWIHVALIVNFCFGSLLTRYGSRRLFSYAYDFKHSLSDFGMATTTSTLQVYASPWNILLRFEKKRYVR